MNDRIFAVGALSAGYIYDFPQLGVIAPGVGISATLDVVGKDLGAIDDTRTPWGGMLFVRVRAPTMKMSHASGMPMPMSMKM